MSELLLLKKEDCKSCYKCIRECALKSIRFSENRAQIVERECVYCGHCYVTCPQSAKEIRRDTDKAKALIASGRPVIVSLAPSFIADFGVGGLDGIRPALLQLGFADVEETARGAKIVKTEYERMIASGEHKLIISSCCHSVNLLIQKRYPQALPYLAKVDSPMLAHARSIKERVPGSAVVFIGPCISKKDEAERYGQVDCVLTFDELIDWLAEEGIELPAGEPDGTEARSRFFPTAGGIIRSMDLDDGLLYPHRWPAPVHGCPGGDRAGRYAELLCGDERLRGQLHRRPGDAPLPQLPHHLQDPGGAVQRQERPGL